MNNFEEDYIKAYERLYLRQRYFLKLNDAVSDSNFAGLSYEGKLLQQQLVRMALEMLDEAKQDYDNMRKSQKRKALAANRRFEDMNRKVEEFKKRHSEILGEDYDTDNSETD